MRPERHLRSVLASGGGVGEAPPPARHSVTLLGARGGQGTTTVACALAVMAAAHEPTTIVTADPDCSAAVLGLARPTATPAIVAGSLSLDTTVPVEGGFTVIDGGRLGEIATPRPGVRLAVLRGPCYLALAALHDHAGSYDAVVVVEEPDRALTARDVTDVLDVPVAATVRTSTAVAQAIDAGLLVARVHRLAEFADLRRVLRPIRATPAPPDRHTDLHRPEFGRFPNKIACRDRPSQRHVVPVWDANHRVEHRAPGRGCR